MLFHRRRPDRIDQHPARDIHAERLSALVHHISDVITVLGVDGRVEYQSPSLERLLGYRPDEAAEGPWFLLHPGDIAAVQRYLARCRATPGGQPPLEVRVRHRDGSWRYVELTAFNLLDAPAVHGLVVTWRDITQRKGLEQQLARQAFYDPLTGLPNRTLFFERLERALIAAREHRGSVGVLFLDLDGFKIVNDSLGHAMGDLLLAAAGRRILACLHPDDMAARFGGDEFTVLIERLWHPSVAVQTAERIIRELRRPFTIEGQEIFVGATVGIAVSTPGGPPVRPAELVREADTALYAAKAAGKGRAVLFDPSMNSRVLERLNLEAELRRALEQEELRLFYQPEVDLGSGRVIGLEALVRWQHPVRGLVPPSEFIPFAEESGLIVPIGRWVLAEACRQAQVWRQVYPSTPLVVGVNLSARQFQQPDLVDEVEHVLARSGLPPASLKLEITEGTLMEERAAAAQVLRRLRGLGVQLAIDDFGTGYSALSYLREFAVDTLKIDRSFLHGLEHDRRAAAIVRAVASLGHALGMNVTAEGVETPAQLVQVRISRCDTGQGYYFSRPLPSAEIEALMRAGRQGLAARVS